MNKQTRTFIWGFILFAACTFFAAQEYHEIKHAAEPSVWNYFWLLANIIMAVIGLRKIDKVTY